MEGNQRSGYCFHRIESGNSSGRGCAADQGCTEECNSQGSDYGSSYTGRSSGRRYEVSSFQYSRSNDRIYGNGNGTAGRRSQYAGPLPDGGTAGSTVCATESGSTAEYGGSGRSMEMRVRS